MEQVAGYSRALCLPVQPKAACAVMDMVSADNHINGRMHFYAADFCAGKVLFVIDMVDVIAFYNGKYTAKMAYDSGLAAVMDIAAADNVGTDIFFVPSFIGGFADAFPFGLGAVFIFPFQPFIVVFRLKAFA